MKNKNLKFLIQAAEKAVLRSIDEVYRRDKKQNNTVGGRGLDLNQYAFL